MSSTFIKALKCYQCSKYFLIEDINFPEDIFESIRKNKLDQNLFWICDSCISHSNKVYSVGSFDNSFRKSPAAYREIDIHAPSKKYENPSDESDYMTDSETSLVKTTSSPDGNLPCLLLSSKSPSSPPVQLLPDKDKSARKYTHSILNSIKIHHEDKSKNKRIINSVLDCLLNDMKKNDEFKGMMNRQYYTGSAYNDLKITEATEYDIDIVLKVPKHIKLSPEYFDGNCAFLKLKWEPLSDLTDSSMKFFTENSDENYLNPEKVLSWLQRHIDLTLQKSIEWPEHVSKVINSASGPARTIVISTSFGYNISIDLVPVFEFEHELLSSTTFYDKFKEIALDGNGHNCFFAVPKKCTEDSSISLSDSKLCWRLDFPNAEKYILSEKQCAKSVIKILKIFRDKRDWKGIASYYLKMVVMLEILKNSSEEHWRNGNEYQRLLDSFKQLAKYLGDGYLPHFLTQQNLIQKFNKDNCNNWSNYLKRKIPSWESNPANIVKFLNDDKENIRISNL